MKMIKIIIWLSLFQAAIAGNTLALDLSNMGNEKKIVDIKITLNELSKKTTIEALASSFEQRILGVRCSDINGNRQGVIEDIFKLPQGRYNHIILTKEGNLKFVQYRDAIKSLGPRYKKYRKEGYVTKGEEIYINDEMYLYLLLKNSYGYKEAYSDNRFSPIRDIKYDLMNVTGKLGDYYYYNIACELSNNRWKKRKDRALKSVTEAMASLKKDSTDESILTFLNDYDKIIESLSKKLENKCGELANKEKIAKENEINQLLAKYDYLAIPHITLKKKFQTYAGMGMSGEISTLVEFISKLNGTLSATTTIDGVILTQSIPDELTGSLTSVKYLFVTMPNLNDSLFLNRAVVNNEEYPQSSLYHLVIQIISAQ